MTKRAAIYTRVSVAHDDRETSTERQEQACRAYCEMKGWEVAEIFTDRGVSAFSGKDRPGWIALEAAVRNGDVDAVVVFAISRAARNTGRLLQFVELCKDSDVVFASTSEPTSGNYGKVFVTILASLAELESEMRSARITSKHEEIAAHGMFSGGKAPFGYDVVKTDGGTTLVLNDTEAALIRDAARRILEGEPLRPVGRLLGRDARNTKQILTSDRIAGDRVSHGAVTKKDAWPAIIDRTTLTRLRAEFARRTAENGEEAKPKARKYLLTGLLVCGGQLEEGGTCGRTLVGHPQRHTATYACLSTKKHEKGGKPRILTSAIDEYVSGQVYAYTTGEHEVVAEVGADQEPIFRGLEAAQEKLSEVAELFARDAITADQMLTITTKTRAKMADLEKQLARVAPKRSLALAALESVPDDWPTFISDPVAAGEVRADVESVVERIVINPAGRNKWAEIGNRVEIVWKAAPPAAKRRSSAKRR